MNKGRVLVVDDDDDIRDIVSMMLSEEGYDPAFGARPLKRAIQRLIQNPLAMQLLEGRFHDRDHIVVTVGAGGSLAFERAGASATEPAGVA